MTPPERAVPSPGAPLPSVLPWPPPGTEPLHGLLRRVRLRGAMASLLVALPILFLALDPGYLVADAHARWLLGVLGGAVFLGVAMWVGAGLAVLSVVDGVRRAGRLGYGPRLLLEVAADTQGDGGALATGMGPYQGVAPDTRAGLRRLRVWRAWLAGLAAALPTPCVMAALLLAFRGGLGPLGVLLLTFGPALAIGLVAGVMAGWERGAAALDRGAAAWDPDPSTPGERAEAWRAAAAAAGVPRTAPAGGRGLLWVAGLTGVGALAVAFLLTVTMVGAAVVSVGTLAASSERWLMALPAVDGALELRALVRGEETDSALTPAAAGGALHHLLASYANDEWHELAAAGVLRPAPSTRVDSTVLRALNEEMRRVGRYTPAYRSANGADLSAEQRALLARRPPAPAAGALSRVASAAEVDVLGARVALPVPDDAWDDVADAAARAVLQSTSAALLAALADHMAGRHADAEARLREVIRFGTAVLWATPFGAEAAAAGNAARAAAYNLNALLATLGRHEEAAAIEAVLARAAAQGEMLSGLPGPTGREAEEMLEGFATGRSLPRATRLEALRRHEFLRRCGSVSGVLFAPERFPLSQEERASLAPTPADEAYLGSIVSPPPRRFWRSGAGAFIAALLGERTVTGVCRPIFWANPRWR